MANAYQVEQLGPENAITIHLTALLRNGTLHSRLPTPKKVVHVGHSYGSAISQNLAAPAPSLTDGFILTGFSTDGAPYANEVAISSNFALAKSDPKLSQNYTSDGWLVLPDEMSTQFAFFHYPAFSPAVLQEANGGKHPFSLAELLTTVPTMVPKFDGPALVISGQYDRVFCGGWCEGILQKAASYFPKAKPFESYVQPNTGHGMNLHFNATGTYKVINDFITANVGA